MLRAPMPASRYLWLALPAVGLLELGGHAWARRRAPALEEWREAAPVLASLRKSDELVVVAPYWAEPLARQAFGDAAFPLEQVARPDETGFARALEVSLLGEQAPELRGWRPLEERRAGRLRFRVLENPAHEPVLFDFVSAFAPDSMTVASGSPAEPCQFQERARAEAGGLHGPVAFPSRRFQCHEGFVGVTVLEDQRYRPRRCLYANPPSRGEAVLVWYGVPMGRRLRGHTGLSWFLHRDGTGTPVEMEILVEGESVGRVVHRDEEGFRPFELGTERFAGRRARVEARVSSASPRDRHFCFHMDAR